MKSSRDSVYISSILAAGFLVWINVITILAFFGFGDPALPSASDPKWLGAVKIWAVLIPICGLLRLVVPKQILEKSEPPAPQDVVSARIFMGIYFLVSFGLLLLVSKA
jgi:hypothetical protein